MNKTIKPFRRKSKADDLPDFSNAKEFEALSAQDKEKVWNYYR